MTNQENKTTERAKKLPFIRLYHGYGHSRNVVVYGHVFKREPRLFKEKRGGGMLSNLVQLLKLFRVRTIPNARLQVLFEGQEILSKAEYDGFFKIEIHPAVHLEAGWHKVFVNLLDDRQQIVSTGEGKIFVPHVSQYAFISDIDDTIMRSFSATIFKRLYELLSRGPGRRRLFAETAQHYNMLAHAHAAPDTPNPFFYVSSSEWNLYDYLQQVFRRHQLPEGIYLLNQIKRWNELLKSGKTGHEGKLIRIARILKAFPKQKFVLLGDNSQRDPQIYKSIADKHPEQIYAVYIRNVRSSKEQESRALLQQLEAANIHTCIFENSSEAIVHGISIGLIAQRKSSAKKDSQYQG